MSTVYLWLHKVGRGTHKYDVAQTKSDVAHTKSDVAHTEYDAARTQSGVARTKSSETKCSIRMWYFLAIAMYTCSNKVARLIA